MFKKILLCTDLSPVSEILSQCSCEIKKLGVKEIILAHIIEMPITPGLEDRLAAAAKPDLEKQKAFLEDQGIKVIIEISFGVPPHVLNELAEKHDVSVILIGSHGRGVTSSVALGSVSSKLLQVTDRPVFLSPVKLLKGEKCSVICQNIFSHILHPTDFSDTAEKAFSYLETVVGVQKCPVTLLHVKEQDRSPDRSDAEEELRRLALARMKRMKVCLESIGAAKVTTLHEYGDPAAVIVETGKIKNCSLILMGSQGKGFVKEIMLGSVAHEVARRAETPVVFIPAIR
jgi:nucleotide-binding universal stress UspA family protein